MSFSISSAEIMHLSMPTTHPFTTGFGTVDHKETVIVKLRAGDLVGYGEGSALNRPDYVPEYAALAYHTAGKFVAPSVIGKELEHPERMVEHFGWVREARFAKTAVECALWDLYSQAQGRSVADLLGGTQTHIEVGESLGIKRSVAEVLKEVGLRLSEGYKRIKIKTKPGWDIEVIEAIRKEFGDIKLMVDGNSSYTLDDLDALRALDQFGLMMIEQPLAYDDIHDHVTLQQAIKTPVCLDESILNVKHAELAIKLGACKIINIKPGRVGGLVEAKKIHDLCRKLGIGVWCGGLLETGIGRFFNLSVASLPGYSLPADMSPSHIFFAEDVVRRPFRVVNGRVVVPDSLEGDYGVDEEKLKDKKYLVRSEVVNKPID